MNGSLNPKRRRFVAEYLKDQNGTQAAIRSGYSKRTANEQSSQLLANLNVQAAVDEGLRRIEKKSDITVGDLRAAMMGVIRADPLDAFNADGTLKPLNEIPKDVRLILAGIEVDDERGELKRLRFMDRARFYEMLGKHLRMFTDVHELTGKNGAPLVPPSQRIDFSSWTKDELMRAAGVTNGGAPH